MFDKTLHFDFQIVPVCITIFSCILLQFSSSIDSSKKTYFTYLLKKEYPKGEKNVNEGKNENVELPHSQVFCDRLCVLCK